LDLKVQLVKTDKIGTNGSNGIGLLFDWDGTRLGVKRENADNYSYQDLKGQAGQNGINGNDGYTPVKGVDYFTSQDKAEIQTPISDQYDTTKTYDVGDYCIYNNTLYKCTTEISTAEEFDSSHWTVVNVSEELTKSVMTASFTTNYSIQQDNTYEQLVLDASIEKGKKLSLDAGGIKIGKGINKVLVSGKVVFNTLIAGTKWFSIYKNSGNIAAFPAVLSGRNALTIPAFIVEVKENDVIIAKVQGTASDVVRGNRAYSYLTVQEI